MIQNVKGTKDQLPSEISGWQFIENIFKNTSDLYGYKELRTPIFEKTEVFSRSIGEETDIVNKEMYTFTDRGGDLLTLRPEMTAALVRSVIQNSLIQQQSNLRLWYFGPFFRYERPQKGRLRQFHQYGAECIGSVYPESDAEVIMLANNILESAGISDYKLIINTLGNDISRTNYRNELIKYLRSNINKLSNDSRNRLENNPLRVLDSKSEQDQEVIENAPVIIDFLDTESDQHYSEVKSFLDDSGIIYEVNPHLVRGLDYYNHTVFEFQSNMLGAQDSFGGGGRYDGLIKQLGGKDTPAVGFALGVERLLLILEKLNDKLYEPLNPDFYIVVTSPELISKANEASQILRSAGNSVIIDLQRRSIKAQFRDSGRMNAKYTLIVGEEELSRQVVRIKNMATSIELEVPIIDLVKFEV